MTADPRPRCARTQTGCGVETSVASPAGRRHDPGEGHDELNAVSSPRLGVGPPGAEHPYQRVVVTK